MAVAILIKLSLFVGGTLRVADSKMAPDTAWYLELGKSLYEKGSFSLPDQYGATHPETFRTPGYPLFLAVLHDAAKIPLNGVILVQVMLTLLVAWIIYIVAGQIDGKIAPLSAIIFLFDLPTTMIALRLLTEVLFMLFTVLFVLSFVLYLRRGAVKFLILSALAMVVSVYVRPGAYYLGAAVAVFIVYANVPRNIKRALMHAVLFGAVVFSLLGAWQVRNYNCCKVTAFSTVNHGIDQANGIASGYTREQSPSSHGEMPAEYYSMLFLKAAVSFMTMPGSLKYFGSSVLTNLGKVLGYAYMVFWMIGFLVGTIKTGRNIYYQFLLLIIACFLFGSALFVTMIAGDRFRAPVVPCIVMISAYGWGIIWKEHRKDKTNLTT